MIDRIDRSPYDFLKNNSHILKQAKNYDVYSKFFEACSTNSVNLHNFLSQTTRYDKGQGSNVYRDEESFYFICYKLDNADYTVQIIKQGIEPIVRATRLVGTREEALPQYDRISLSDHLSQVFWPDTSRAQKRIEDDKRSGRTLEQSTQSVHRDFILGELTHTRHHIIEADEGIKPIMEVWTQLGQRFLRDPHSILLIEYQSLVLGNLYVDFFGACFPQATGSNMEKIVWNPGNLLIGPKETSRESSDGTKRGSRLADNSSRYVYDCKQFEYIAKNKSKYNVASDLDELCEIQKFAQDIKRNVDRTQRAQTLIAFWLKWIEVLMKGSVNNRTAFYTAIYQPRQDTVKTQMQFQAPRVIGRTTDDDFSSRRYAFAGG